MSMNSGIKKKFNQVKKEIAKSKNILLLAHHAPDGDAIGSLLALNLYLKIKKKKVCVYAPGCPKFLNFLYGFDKIQKKLSKNSEYFDLVFILDYADKDRIGIPPNFSLDSKKIISIDHHSKGRKIGDFKILSPKASSVCEILYYFFETVGGKIDKKMATLILAGILTDTVGFSFASKATEKVIGELIKKGGEVSKIMRNYHHLSIFRARLLSKMIFRIKQDKDLSLIHSWLSFSDFSSEEKFRKEKEHSSKKRESYFQEPPIFSDFLPCIGEAEIYLFLTKQKKGKIKGGLRSHDGIDVASIAEKFGGGGHKCAAGFKIKGTISGVLKKVKKELRERKNE